MKIVAIDTASSLHSLALLTESELIVRVLESSRDQSRELLSVLDELLAKANLRLNQLDAIAFGQGPGSFTGLRIAASTAQGLAYGSGLPVIGVSNCLALASLARRRTSATDVLVAIDARLQQVYWAHYHYEQDNWQLIGEESVIAPAELKLSLPEHFQAIGEGFVVYREQFPFAVTEVLTVEPLAGEIAQLALEQQPVNAVAALPIYIRNKVTFNGN